MPARRLHPILLASALGLVGCRTPSSKLPVDQLREVDEDGGRSGEAREALEPLPVEAPVDMLPAEVAVLAEAIDPSALLAMITRLDKYPEFQQVRAQASAELGVDFLDPQQWRRIGLDSQGPAGIGLLDIAAEGVVAYATVSDAAALGDFVEQFADIIHQRDSLAAAEIGDAKVFRIGEELSVIVRSGFAVAVFVDRPERSPRDYAATVATIDPREALGHTEGFGWARAQLEQDDDGLIYVAPAELLAQIDRSGAIDTDDYGVRYTEDELARARKSGASPELIRELELRLEEERRWQQEREARDRAERELVRSLLDPVGAFMVAAELRDDAIEAHARALIPGEGLLRELFVPTEAESPLLRAVDDPPMMAVDGRANMQALLKIVELFARAEGGSLQEVNTELTAELGIDVLGSVVPALTGAGGVMLTRECEPNSKRLGEVERCLGLAAHVELARPDAIRSMLDALARSQRIDELTPAKRGDGWQVRVGDWHEVHLEIVGDRLIAATDPKLAARIRDAKPGAQADALADPSHPMRGPIPTPSLRIYQRWEWAIWAGTHEPWEQEAESMLYDLDTHPVLTPEEAAAVPRSRAFRKKLRELEKAVAELNAHERRKAARRFERSLQIGRALGDAGLQIERIADGLGMHATWRMAPGTTPLELLMRMWMPYYDGDDDAMAEYQQIMQRIDDVRNELQQIRQRDLDAAGE